METDADLLRRYVEEHAQDAFAALVRRHLPRVYGTALRRVGYDAHAAEDVAQAVFADLARKAASLRGRATLTGWLVVGAHRAAAEMVRSEQRRKTRETEAEIMQTLRHDSAAADDPDRLRPLLDDAVVQLAEGEREAIALRFFDNRSFAEVGAALRITDEAARKRVDRALEKLRRILSRRGVTSTGAVLAAVLAEQSLTTPPSGLAAEIAGRALAHGAAAGMGLAAWGGAMLAGAGMLAGVFAVVHQHRSNQQLAADVARLNAEARAIAAVDAENRQLARVIAEADDLRRAQAKLPVLRAALAPTLGASAAQAPVRATVTVTSEGMILWNREPVRLGDFLARLAAFEQNAPGGDAKLGIRGFSSFPPLAYVIREARKAKIDHVVVESAATIDPKIGEPLWFQPP